MSDKSKDNEVKRMVDDSKPDGQFGYVPPNMKAQTSKDEKEEKGYDPPSNPTPPPPPPSPRPDSDKDVSEK